MIRNRPLSSGPWVLSKELSHSDSQDLSFKEMEEELTCPVCLELYADPLMLPCSHSICKACLRDIMTSRAKVEKQGLDCPACRHNHYLNADQVIKLPKNLALENIVFRYQEIRSCSLSKISQLDSPQSSTALSTSTAASNLYDSCNAPEKFMEKCYCGMCEEPEGCQAEWFCQQCQVYYCQSCLDSFHPKRGSLSKHKVRKPTLKESVECMLHCPDHNSESASIFCDTCNVVACHLCVCQGPGSHCGHVILDLETARKQLQESLQVAKNELSTLMVSFSDQDSVIDTHIQDMKEFEDSARNIISSQYNCILSDIAATLNLVKTRSLESICTISNQHSSHLAAHSHQIKTVLLQCQNLGAACDSLLSVEETNDIVHESSRSDSQNLRSFSDSSYVSASKGLENLPLKDNISHSDVVSETHISKCSTSITSAKQHDRPTLSRKSFSCDIKSSTTQPEMNVATHDQNISSNQIKDGTYFKNRSVSDSKDNRRASFSNLKLRHADAFEISGVKTKSQVSNDKPLCHADKSQTFDHGRKDFADQKILDLKTEEKSHTNHSRIDKSHRLLSTRIDRALDTPVFEKSIKEKTKPEDQLLLRAVEVGPVLKQVAALIKENECQKSMEAEDAVIPSNDEDKNILTHVSDFHTSCLTLLSNISDHFPSDYPIITPTIRSVVTPLSLGQSAFPRVQSRTLITWGFNSTTFTADPLEGCVQWSVNVQRNTSHIGDIRTGYLFGIGVSTKPLSSKEQAGMTPESCTIACIGGQLVFCQDKVHNVIIPLTDLPICATIAATISKVGLVMAYKLMMSGMSSAICGQRVIALDTDKSVYSSENELKVYPVFTVSQRVKLQFPMSSNV